ncbi:MAG TPA: hypothetical protein VL096_10250, partial [Pirellulaceae bacterium]|nr:hypothetical protein [Pirellulaceae bacterium]
RISIVGQKINSDGQVEFGTLGYGKGAKTRLKLKVRDQDGDLRLAKINVRPSFVNVTLTPASVEGVTGLYDLVVEVPPDAEPCGYRGDAMGTIDFEFAHPRIKDLQLLVDFSVRPPKETR